MTVPVRTTEPTRITQGERIEWTKTLCDYPATLWELQYRYRGYPGTGKDVDATADGTDFNAILIANAPATFNNPGTYQWQAWITEIATPTNTFIVESGTIEVLQGFTEGETQDVDLRSMNRKILDSINLALQAFSESDVQEYEITTPAGSRRVKRSDKTQLLEMRKTYATLVTNEIAREGARNGKPLMGSVQYVVYDE